MDRFRSTFAFLVIALTLILAGCDAAALNELIPRIPTAVVQATPTLPPTPTTPAPTQAPTQAGPLVLTIWVPPQFNPQAGTPAGQLFQARLDAFLDENPNVNIIVRVKAMAGKGGLLESLSAASAAAPTALPSLIALPRTDLETAALKGLIMPLEGLSDIQEDADWYPFARQLAEIQGSTFGLPFGGDALVLMYRPEKVGIRPTTWAEVMSLGQPVVFPAADPQALVTLALYRSTGALVEDEQHRPAIESDNLAEVLSLYADGARLGSFPAWLTQYQTDGQVWQAFREERGNLLVSWSSRYLAELPLDTTATALPTLGDEEYTIATGWLWALSDPNTNRHPMAVELARYLTETEYMAEWTAAAGYLPPRPSALDLWQDQGMKTMLNRVVLAAQVRPANDLVAIEGQVLEEAVTQVIKGQVDPIQAAEAAAERLNSR